jgi:hypothetical protein
MPCAAGAQTADSRGVSPLGRTGTEACMTPGLAVPLLALGTGIGIVGLIIIIVIVIVLLRAL